MSKTQWYIGAPNGVVVCVNSASATEFKGVFYHSYSEEPVRFNEIEQLVSRMEELYDWLHFPFPGNSGRSFAEIKKENHYGEEKNRIMSDDSLLSRHGDVGTFIVRVQHRQNSSWQGRITWMEQDRTVQFRSVWEMMKLMESAVNTVSQSEDVEEATWFDGDEKK